MNKSNYLILLPPSEGKTKGGDEQKPYRIVQNQKEHNYFLSLQSKREYIFENLVESVSIEKEETLQKAFDVKGKNLLEAIELNQDLLNQSTMPAINRFSGVMFKAIDFQNLNKEMQEKFNQNVIFIDAIFGLLKPNDLIPNYKLKIASKINNINITKFWQENLKQEFKELFQNKIIINILPEAHAKVLPILKDEIKITFFIKKDNKIKQAGHLSKILKGEIIKYILQENQISREYLEKFTHSEGFSYSKELSNPNLIAYLIEK